MDNIVTYLYVTSMYVFLALHKYLQYQKHTDIYIRTGILPQLLYSTIGNIGSIKYIHLVLVFVRQILLNLIQWKIGIQRSQENTVYKTLSSTFVTYVPTVHKAHNLCQYSLTVCATRQRDLFPTPTDTGVPNCKSGFRVCI